MEYTEQQIEIFNEIIKNEYKREAKTLSRYACKSSESIRFKEEKIPDRSTIRPAFFHDADRIIHSKAYTRYIDKTQVFSLFENDMFSFAIWVFFCK